MILRNFFFKGLQLLLITLFVYLTTYSILYFITVEEKSLLYHTSPVLRSQGKRHSFKSLQEFERTKKEKFDFVVMGSSHAYRSYDPRIFAREGYRIHNLGTSSQRIMHSYVLGNTLINRSITDCVIIDLYSGAITGTIDEASTNLIQNIPTLKGAVQMALHSKDIRAINMLTLKCFDHLFLKKSEIDTTVNYNKRSVYINGGFAETKDSINAPNPRQRYQYIKGNSNLKYLEKLLRHFEKEKLKVFIVFTPTPKEYRPQNKEEYVLEISQLASAFKNVTMLDFTSKLDLNSQHHFYDHRHLNQSGVEIFNKVLISELKEYIK